MNLAAARSRVDVAFNELERARQYLKERSLVRVRNPFGSPERDTDNYLYEEAERDYQEKLAAFQWATKQFDDTRAKKQRREAAAQHGDRGR
jgi:hypothetical protein